MNINEAILFLKTYQPMPNDDSITEDLINTYDEVRKFAMHNPSEELIELFMKSYGCGDGLGVYPLVEDFFKIFNEEIIIEHLKQNLKDDSLPLCTKYWLVQVALSYPSYKLIDCMNALKNQNDEDISEFVDIFNDILTK